MAKGIIRLCYRKIIDASSQKLWDKYVFDDTYQEFFMQAQYYNQQGQYNTFQELLDYVPHADRLHQLTSSAAIGYIRQLNQLIPEVVGQTGKLCLPFSQFTFEIIQSHVQNKQEHRVAISFFSDDLTWIDTINHMLLIAYGNQKEALHEGKAIDTELISLQPYLSISSYQPMTSSATQ